MNGRTLIMDTGCGRVEVGGLTDAYAPRVLPFNWKSTQPLDESVRCYQGRSGLRVVFSAMRERDGKNWIHVSCSRTDRLPSWEDLRAVKDLFIGKEREALQVLESDADYVNIHAYCLHLWHCLDGPVCPAFATEGVV